VGNKRYKCKNIITHLVSDKIQVKTSMLHAKKLNNKLVKRVRNDVISSTTTINDNKINYVFWNELIDLSDCLRPRVKQITMSISDNEILSIIEKLREASFIIN